MELFRLLGTVVINNSEANEAIQDTTNTAEKSEGKISGSFAKIGNAAVAVGKTVAVGLAAGTTAIAGLATAAIKEYANYEQLVGGVETLFKESAEIVQGYAENAYKTAGISANAYMETVTSFSASLLQSLNGDTQKAAAVADMAITDMADNANKMGTSMETIQTAYQGFAKQNYDMLDNLKLGYGGTKEEMERLLEDAAKLSGVEYDISNLNDVYEAIHVVQTEMGITGTTAKEASSTISGSLATVKASWSDLLTAISSGENIDGAINNLVEGVLSFGDNLIPRIESTLEGVGKAIQTVVPKIAQKVPTLLNTVMPILVNSAVTLINAFISSLTATLPTIIDAIITALPELISGLEGVLNEIIAALPAIMEVLVAALPELMPQIINAVVSMVLTLIEYLPDIIQPIIDNLPTIISSIITALLDNLPILIQGLIQLIVAIVQALPQILSVLVKAMPTIYESLIEALIASLPILLAGIVVILGEVGLAILEYFSEMWESVKEVFAPVSEFFGGIWESIKEAFSSVTGWFEEKFSTAWEKVKAVFNAGGQVFEGIKEGISGVFSTVVNGLITGINKVIAAPLKGVNKMLNKIRNVGILDMKPFKGLWDKDPIEIPEIPKLELAKGGVVDKATPAIFGEDGAEAVVPLERNTQWIQRVAEQLNGSMNQNAVDMILAKLDALLKAISQLAGLQIVLDNGVLVGELAPNIDSQLGILANYKERGG